MPSFPSQHGPSTHESSQLEVVGVSSTPIFWAEIQPAKFLRKWISNWIGGDRYFKTIETIPSWCWLFIRKKKRMLGKIGTYITHFDLPTQDSRNLVVTKITGTVHRPNEIAPIPKCLWGLASSAFMVGMPGSFFFLRFWKSTAMKKYGPKWLFRVYGWNTTQL